MPPTASLAGVSTLGVWGLDDAAETTYRALLRNPDFDEAALSRHLERTPAEVAAALGELARVGLVALGPDGPVPSAPGSTLAALVHGELADLEDRRARLDAVRAALSGFAADHLLGQSRGWAAVPVELLSRAESFVAVEDLQRSTRGEVLSCHPAVDLGVDAPAYVELVEQQLAAGRPMRGLYPLEVLGAPQRLAYVRRWAEAGERVRLTNRVLPTVVVFGDEVALVGAEAGAIDLGEQSGRLLVRAPALVALARALVEGYWAQASPLPAAAPGASRNAASRPAAGQGPPVADRTMLDLLRLGLKDESIARQLGMSLRTVRRRIAALLDDLGATTRFQAGVEAARRGLLGMDDDERR